MLAPKPSPRYLEMVRKLTDARWTKGPGHDTLHNLERRLERQHLVLQALLLLLFEKQAITEEELSQWINYIDSLDGALDGKLRPDPTPIECPKCHRKNRRSALACQYCSTRLEPQYIDPRTSKE